MVQAYSRLRRVLGQRNLTVQELHRRIRQQGMSVNLKSLYRLNNDSLPVERLDLRVAGIICAVCAVPLSELIAFESPRPRLRHLPRQNQKRLDELMERNNNGGISHAERRELKGLVREAEEIALDNARTLAKQRQRLFPPEA